MISYQTILQAVLDMDGSHRVMLALAGMIDTVLKNDSV